MALPLLAIAAIGVGVTSIGADMFHSTSNWNDPNKSKRKRRGPSDYEPTSFTVGGTIEPLQPLRPVQQLGQLVNLQTLRPLAPIQPLSAIPPKKTVYKNPEFNEFTDPLEVNSLSDVLFNQEGRNIIMEDLGLDWVDDIPLLCFIAEPAIVGTDMLWHNFAKPISQGEFAKAGLNALYASGETLDIFANPIKGLIIDGPEGFTRGLGIGNEGRIQYDYDFKTGNGALDLVLNMTAEIFSDPLNIISMGSSSVIKSTAKKAVEGISKEFATEIPETILKKQNKQIVRDLVNSQINKGVLDIESALKNNIDNLLKGGVPKEVASKYYTAIVDEVNTLNSRSILKSVTAFKNSAEKLDNTLLKITPLGLTMKGAGKLIGPKADSVLNWVKTKYTKSFESALDVPGAAIDKATKSTILDEINTHVITLNKLTYDTYKLPDFTSLCQKYRALKIQGETKDTIGLFVKQLKTEGVIDDAIAKQLLKDPQFKLYYDTIAEYATIVETVRDVVSKKANVLDARVNEILTTSKSKYEFMQNISELYSKEIGLEETVGLATIDKALKAAKQTKNAQVTELRSNITRLKNKVKTPADEVRLLKLTNTLEVLESDVTYLDSLVDTLKTNLNKAGVELTDAVDIPPSYILDAIKGLSPEEATVFIKDNINKLNAEINKVKSTRNQNRKQLRTLIDLIGDNVIADENTVAIFKVLNMLLNNKIGSVDVDYILDNLNFNFSKYYTTYLDLDMSFLHELNNDTYRAIVKELNDMVDMSADAYNRAYVEKLAQQKGAMEELAIKNLIREYHSTPDLINVFKHTKDDYQKALNIIDKPNKGLKVKSSNTVKSLDKLSKASSDNFNIVQSISIIDDVDALLNKDITGEYLLKDVTVTKEARDDVAKTIDAQRSLVKEDVEKVLNSFPEDVEVGDYSGTTFMSQASEDAYNTVQLRLAAMKEKALNKGYNNLADLVQRRADKISPAISATDYSYTLKEISLINELLDVDLTTNKGIEHAMEILDQLGYSYDVTGYHNSLLRKLFPDEKDLYYFKTNQLEIHRQILEAYQTNPVVREFIYGLATGDNTTVAAAVLNTLADAGINDNALSFSTSTIRQLQEFAKAQVAYESLLNNVLLNSEADDQLAIAFLDMFSGKGYVDKGKILEHYMPGGVFDLEKLRRELDLAYNNTVSMYAQKNADLARYFGMEVDETKLHDALYDGTVGIKVHEGLINKGAMPTPKEGQVFTYFDLEATGKNLKHDDQILQIAATKYTYTNGEFKVIDTFNEYVELQRGYSIDPQALEEGVFDRAFLNNIKKGSDESFAAQEFLDFAEGTLIGHNIDTFDIPLFRDRTGQDLSDLFEIQDTYKASRKMFKAKEIDDDALLSIGAELENYLNTIKSLASVNKTIQLMDAQAANNLFDVARDIADIVVNNNSIRTLEERISNGILEQALEGVLGKTDISSVNKELAKLTKHEWTDAIKGVDVGSDESVIKQIRDILQTVKDNNRKLRTYITTGSKLQEFATKVTSDLDIGLDYTIKLNMHGVLNGIIEEAPGKYKIADGYQFGVYSSKRLPDPKLYTDSLKRKIQREVTEPAAINQKLMSALDVLDDANTDPLAKMDAFEVLGAYGYNYTQASRLKYSIHSYDTHATAPSNMSDRVKGILTYGDADVKVDMDLGLEYADKITKLDKAQYRQLNEQICLDDTFAMLDPDRTPAQFTAFLTEQAGGLGYIGNINNPRYKKYVDNLLSKEKEFNDLGYKFVKEDDGLFIIPFDKKRAIENAKQVAGDYNLKRIERNYTGPDKDIMDSAQKIHQRFNNIVGGAPIKTHQDFASNIIYADTFYKLKRKHYAVFKDSVLNDDEWISMFFNSRTPRYTYGVVGSINGQRAFNEMYSMPLNHNIDLVDRAIKRVDGRNKFIELYFNNDFSVNSKYYKDLSDVELLDMYKTTSKDFTFMVLVKDKKTGEPIVRTFKPNTVEDITWLRNMEGVLTTQYHANSVINSINKQVLDNKFKCPVLQFWYKYVVSFYKSTYLTSVGLIARNYIDIIIKNTVGRTPEDIPISLLEFHKAFKDWKTYQGMIEEIITKYGTKNSENILEYFEDLRIKSGDEYATAMEQLFQELDQYATSNVSAGMATAQERLLMDFYTKSGSRADIPAQEWYIEGAQPSKFDEWFSEKGTVRKINKKVMDFNTYIEHAGRISNLRMGLAKGLDEAEAFSRVLRTHFDYVGKSKAQMYAELVFPFITFPAYNIQYWVDAAFESPWLVELLLDTTRTSLDFEEQKQFTIENSQRLQAALLNGNVRIGDTLFKVNPSLMDAFQLVQNPMEQLDQRALAPIKLATKAILEGTGALKEQQEEGTYVNENVTNLAKLGYEEQEKILNDLGLYTITRAANNITKGVFLVDKERT